MNGIETIRDGDVIMAMIIRSNFEKDGITFITPDSFSQQLAYMKHPANHEIAPHIHNPIDREVHLTRETLFIRKGSVRVDLYNSNREYLRSVILKTGDVIILVNEGHGLKMLEKSEIIEVKQGPYAGEQDKTRFEGIKDTAVKFG